jgi:hypothetical protein
MVDGQKTPRLGLLLTAISCVVLVSGCGSGHHTARVQPCSEARRQEHPLACERQDERAEPQVAHMRLLTEAQQRAKRTPLATGETVSEHEQRAQEEIEAERSSG